MSRDKDVCSKPAVATSRQTQSVNVVGVVTNDGRMRKRREGGGGRGRNKREADSQLVGGSARQGGHDLLFRKVSRLLLSQRAASPLRQNRRDDEGQRRSGFKFVPLSSSRGWGEVEAETFGEFCDFFRNSGTKNQRGLTDSLSFRVQQGWWGRERNF